VSEGGLNECFFLFLQKVVNFPYQEKIPPGSPEGQHSEQNDIEPGLAEFTQIEREFS
jgi:hypothetical protein